MSPVKSIRQRLGRIQRQNDLEKMQLENAQMRHQARLTVARKRTTDAFDEVQKILSGLMGDPHETARWEQVTITRRG